MEQWLPLFRHLLACPVANADAFSSFPASGDCPSSPPPAAALLRLLVSPAPTLPASAPDPDPTAAILFQTLPPFLQSQALSFLASSAGLLDPHLVRALAARVLSGPPGRYGFWARRGARHLLDGLPEKEGVPGVASEEFVDGFHEPPPCLKEAAARARPVLPWLPVDCRSVMGGVAPDRGGGDGLDGIGLETLVLKQDEDLEMQEAGCVLPPQAPPLADLIVQRALDLQKEIVTVESVLVAKRVVKDLQDLCVESRNAAAVLSLVQPWEADDDTLRVLLSNLLLPEDGVQRGGLALVLCSVFLPQLLELQRPPSSVLLSAALDLCKLHPAAALEAVLFPLVLRKGGLNVPQCDVLTRIVKECMHPLHVAAFCHRLLSGEEQDRKPVCMPQHHENVGTHLVWTESLFALFYSILSQDICLTPSTIGELISVTDERASEFSRSLKFGNFMLCLVSKCWHQCKNQRVLLERAAERTNTFLTKAILAKLRPAS
ncbi:hypothetical protein PAHAL_4G103700 [Panicum hallii]|uniref:Fanconi Anaemia group E protein C-terminal domain-containing protein n=1 Tax=Panicum hallii TaxID=206008 RepID=A0A2S3HIH5_9POAL|nr:uncharacterized protein LOC112889897 [Panicum hallii]PAN23600.1 hypothetical protein PAHAL_4G103700 [Panicum hallii]